MKATNHDETTVLATGKKHIDIRPGWNSKSIRHLFAAACVHFLFNASRFWNKLYAGVYWLARDARVLARPRSGHGNMLF